MGEMADFYIDRMVDRGLHLGRSRAWGPPLKCKHCGATDVYWQKVHNRKTEYELFNMQTLDRHVCPTTADGFDDEPV